MDEITNSPVKSPMETGEAFGDIETDYTSIRGKVNERYDFVYQHIFPAKMRRLRARLSFELQITLTSTILQYCTIEFQ